jgi:LAO/AO transport system kinase
MTSSGMSRLIRDIDDGIPEVREILKELHPHTGNAYVIGVTGAPGVGQDEVDIAKSAQTTIIVVVPDMGDDIQAIKSGIFEVGDIFAINKADKDGADKTFSDLNMMLDMNQRRLKGAWKPPIVKVQAIADIGVSDLMEEIENYKKYIEASNLKFGFRLNKEKIRQELIEMVKNQLIQEALKRLIKSNEFEETINSIAEGKIDPYSACDNLILPKLRQFK